MRAPWKVCLAAGMMAAAFLVFPSVSRAGSVDLTLNPPSTYTVVEGNSIAFTFTLNNNSGQAFNISTGYVQLDSIVGDSSDLPAINYNALQFTCVGATVASGSSCTITVVFTTPNDVGETDADFGISNWEVGVTGCPFANGVCASNSMDLTTYFHVNVDDVGYASQTPEPGSFALLLTGLGALPAVRLRVWRAGRGA